MSESWLYKLYCTESQDPEGELLYVGISDSPSSRMGNHESQKWWWWLVDKIEWVRCADRQEAEAKESCSISIEHPIFNKAQSQLGHWDRLRDICHLLWAHSHNTLAHPLCHFCHSHGIYEHLSPDSACEVFRRNCDDKLVIHFVVSCEMHGRNMQWAEHVPVDVFLRSFGRAPKDEVAAIMHAAIGDAPWEKRAARVSTLAEQVGTLRQIALMPATDDALAIEAK
jgi:hypothetical protein